MIAFGEFRPDVSDTNAKHSGSILNVVPQADGYGPFKSFEEFTQALPSGCRGYFRALLDGVPFIFAGTETDLYLLNNSTLAWGSVSKDATSYNSIDARAQWQFAQFNNLVFATHRNVKLQQFNLSTDNEFDDTGDDPPQAGSISIVGRFVVLSDLLDNPNRSAWCGLNDPGNWTFGTGLSDFQDFPDGGRVLQVVGGEFGFILQENARRRMVFAPGSDVIFNISRVGEDQGLLGPYSVVKAGAKIFALFTPGFCELLQDGGLVPIGAESIDKTFFARYSADDLHLVLGAADPRRNIVMWTSKTAGSNQDLFDRIDIYNWLLQRWAPLAIEGEFLAQISRPGLTLEGLNAIAPGAQFVSGAADNGAGLIRLTIGSTTDMTTGDVKDVSGVVGVPNATGEWAITVIDGTNIDLQGSTFAGLYTSGGVVGGSVDDLPFSLDDVSTSSLPQVACFNSEHKLGFFQGANLEAVVETPEQRVEGWRIDVNGFFPLTDAPDVFASCSKRDNLNVAHAYSDESPINSDGFCPLLENTRAARLKIRIPAGTEWTYAKGVDLGEMGIVKAGRL